MPILIVAWAWQALAINIPKWDDHIFKAFILNLEKETSAGGAFKQFLKQHNEHRIAYDRLFVWLDYNLFGKFSYKRLMAYGDLSLLALVALFGAYLARYVSRWYILLPPIAFFIISLANWENLYWALSAMQNFGVVVWTLWAFYALAHHQRPGLVRRGGRSVWLAIALAGVATLVSGNGFMAWPIGALMLISQRRFRDLLPWLGAAVVLITLYFFDYQQPPATAPPDRGTLLGMLTGGLAFLGAAAEPLPLGSPFWLSVGLGTLLLIVWGWMLARNVPGLLARTGWSAREAFAFGVVAFILGTAIVVVWSRIGVGRHILLTSRYRIYSLTLLALTYSYWLSINYKKATWPVALAGLAGSSLFWWAAFVQNTHESIQLRHFLLEAQYNWTYTNNRPVAVADPTISRLIDNAPAFYDDARPALFAPSSGPIFPVEAVIKTTDNYIVRLSASGTASAGFPSLTRPDRGAWLLLRSAQRTYLFAAAPVPRRHWRVLLGLLPRYASDGPVDVPIPVTDLAAGTYEVAVVVVDADGRARVRSSGGQLLTAAPQAPTQQAAKNW